MVQRCLSWMLRVADADWWPVLLINLILFWTVFMLFLIFAAPVLFPDAGGWFGTVVEDLRVFCLGWDPVNGTYRMSEIIRFTLPAVIMSVAVAVIWPVEIRTWLHSVGRRLRSPKGIAGLVLVVLSLGGLISLAPGLAPEPDVIVGERGFGPAPDVSLVSDRGESVSLGDFPGRVLLVTFIYTNCGDTCPTTVRRVQRLVDKVGAPPERLLAVAITLDPERDSPAALREIRQAWGLAEERWVLLTGDREEVERVLDAASVLWWQDPVTALIRHDSKLLMIDDQGRWSYTIDPLEAPMEQVVRLTRELLN